MVNDLEMIYQEHGNGVYFFLLSLCRDAVLAEELTQETMLRAIMNIHSFRGDAKMTSWLFQIAKNLYYEHQKKSKRTISLEDAAISPDSGVDLASDLEDKDTAARILYHLHELDEPYKEVFTLHALGEVPLTQISRLFGKSDSWARVTYYRAKAMIIDKLKEGEP